MKNSWPTPASTTRSRGTSSYGFESERRRSRAYRSPPPHSPQSVAGSWEALLVLAGIGLVSATLTTWLLHHAATASSPIQAP